MANCGLDGKLLSTRLSALSSRLKLTLFCAGPLPRCSHFARGSRSVATVMATPHKFTGGIPSEWGALTNLKELKMAIADSTVSRSASVLSGLVFATEVGVVFAQVLCQRCFQLRLRFSTSVASIGIPHKFTGGIPPEWGALTNLKKLNMAHCGSTVSCSAPGLSG